MRLLAALLVVVSLPAGAAIVTGHHPLSRSRAVTPASSGVCGDGVFEAPEACDDGDTDAGDGCSATCTVEAGWSCTEASPSVCSDSPEFYAPLASSTTDTAGGATPTYARATAATGETWDAGCSAATLATIASGTLRYDSRCAAATLYTGAMFEQAAQNLALQSQTFQTTWNPTASDPGDSVSVNAVADPFGGAAADGFVIDSTNGLHSISQSVTLTAANYLFSSYVKAGTNGWVRLQNTTITNCFSHFNLASCAVGTRGAGAQSDGAVSVGGGWCRVWIGFTGTAAAHSFRYYAAEADNDVTVSGDGAASAHYMFGAQVEIASASGSPSSYIPTTTAAATRNADSLTWGYNGTAAGTLEAKILCPAADLSADGAVVTLSDGDADDQISIQVLAAGDAPKLTITSGGGAQAAVTGTTDLFDGAEHTLRATYDSSGATLYVDGSSEGTPDSDGVTVPTTNAPKVGSATGVVLPGCLVYGIKHYNEVVTP